MPKSGLTARREMSPILPGSATRKLTTASSRATVSAAISGDIGSYPLNSAGTKHPSAQFVASAQPGILVTVCPIRGYLGRNRYKKADAAVAVDSSSRSAAYEPVPSKARPITTGPMAPASA